MLTRASVRPQGVLLPTVTAKKWAKAIGKRECLSETCGHLDLNASGPKDAEFLHMLYEYIVGGGTVTVKLPRKKAVKFNNQHISTDEELEARNG